MTMDNQKNTELPAFYKIAPWQVVVLSAATLGVYLIIWHYRSWKMLKDYGGHKVRPGLRTVINSILPVFIYPLFNTLGQMSAKQNLGIRQEAGILSLLYLLLLFLPNVIDSPIVLWVPLLLGLVVAPYVKIQNELMEKTDVPLIRSSFMHWRDALLVIVFWAIYGLLSYHTSLQGPEPIIYPEMPFRTQVPLA